jgi:LysM repeat protein
VSAKTLLTVTTLGLAGALLVAACGGGGGSTGGRPNSAKIPTATAMAVLPEPTILSGGVPVTEGGGGDTYVVKPGDTLNAIAEELGVSVDDLISLNNLADPSRLEVDQVLKVPPRAGTQPTPVPGEPTSQPTGEPTSEATPAATAGAGEYEVQAGDNASDIADRFGVTLQELADANNMTIDDLRTLFVGQVLTIPQFPGRTPEPTSTPEPELAPTEVPTESPGEAPTEAPPEETPQTEEATATPVEEGGGVVETPTPEGGTG